MSGSDDGTCIVWDLDSKQALRTFTHHTGTNQTLSLPWFHRHQGPVTSVACLIKPPHIQNPDFPALNLPCVGVLQRYLTTNAAVFGELENNVDMIEEKSADNERNSFKIDKLKEKIDDLMIENAKLKEFNGALYQKCVDKFMNVE